jgi:hypothetical protein
VSPDAKNKESGTAAPARDAGAEETPSTAGPASAGNGAETGESAEAPTAAETPDGRAADDGATAEDNAADGNTPDGNTPDGNTPGGNAPDGDAADDNAAETVETAAEQTVRDAISVPDAKGRARRATRRFPLFTRDTARPEGGGRAAPGDAPAPARQWPVLTVLGIAALGLLVTALDQFRAGTLLIGAALLAGAALRWLLPGVGMIAVRSRFTDIVTYGVLGGAIVLLALMAQPHPLLEIPFLKDTLHFTLNN